MEPFALGGNSIIWTVTDAAGNMNTCTQIVTVIDAEAPVVSCPADVTIDCQDDSSPAGTGSATATDNCDAMPVITMSDVVFPRACTGEQIIERSWVATDASGNADTCVQTITVSDMTDLSPGPP